MRKYLPIIALIILIASFCVIVPISYGATVTATLNQFTSTATVYTSTYTITNTAVNVGNLDNASSLLSSGVIFVIAGFAAVAYGVFGFMILFGNSLGDTKLTAIFAAFAGSFIALLNHFLGIYFMITYGALLVFAVLKARIA